MQTLYELIIALLLYLFLLKIIENKFNLVDRIGKKHNSFILIAIFFVLYTVLYFIFKHNHLLNSFVMGYQVIFNGIKTAFFAYVFYITFTKKA